MGRLRNFETRVFRRVRRDPPTGKVHRLAFWLFVAYLIFLAAAFLPGMLGSFFTGLGSFTLFLLILFCIPLLWRWLMGRVLWKVRNRLVVTYLLMGLAPVVLFVTLAVMLLYVFSGQFAIFAANTEIELEREHIASQNRAFAMHIAHVLAGDPKATKIVLPEAGNTTPDHQHIGISVAAFENGQPLSLNPSTLTTPDIQHLPGWVHDGFNGIVLDRDRLYLRSVDSQTIGATTVTTVTSLPIEKESVDQIAQGLGSVTILPDVTFDDDENAVPATRHPHAGVTLQRPGRNNVVKVEVDRKGIDNLVKGDNGYAIEGGTLPPKAHFYDIPVRFDAPLETRNWQTGDPTSKTYAVVISRPSLLYQRLFITSLKTAVLWRDALIGLAIFLGLLELVAFYMAVRLNRTITQSIRDLYHATTAVDHGDFSHRIHVTRRDQLAALSTSFNSMIASLARLLVEQREKERLQNELEIAQEVQANLFPHSNVRLPMLDLHGACYPARTVSGDYYDFLVFANGCLGLALGDISGKGISAALLMATLHSAVRAYRFAGEERVTTGAAANYTGVDPQLGEEEAECGELFEEPARILALLNRHLYRSTQPEKYATLFLAHYDGIRSRLVYATGGHLPPLLLRSDDSIVRLDRGGTVVGLIDNMTYEQGVVQLHTNDILIAYSDGVTEPENEFGEFGEERLLEVVRRHRHLPLEAISEQVMQSLRSWIGGQEQPDDITLVLARQR